MTVERTASEDLRELLSTALRRPVEVRGVTRRPSPYGTSCSLEDVDVVLGDGMRLALVRKSLGRSTMLADARRVRPAFVHDPLREIRVYEHALAGSGLGTAGFYGTRCDPAADRYDLYLERVSCPKLCHVGDFAVWTRVARWLGAAHATFATRAGELRDRVPLLGYDETYYHLWYERAATNVGRTGTAARQFRRLARRYDELARALAALPRTLIHGEFYASNVLVDERGGGGVGRVCPVDWEMAACAPGVIDLAALVSGRWTAEEREAMAACYDDGRGDGPASRRERSRVLAYARLHLAVQWVGWSDDWAPPADQAWDWLSEALAVAGELGW